MTEEVIGTFKIEQTPAKYGGYRTVVIDEQGKLAISWQVIPRELLLPLTLTRAVGFGRL
jgi:hypothetical protein